MDKVDAGILISMAKNPRNVTAVARKLGLPAETVRYRVKRMLENYTVKFFGVPNLPKLGLIPYLVFFNSKFSRALEAVLDSHPYVNYVARCYGDFNGYLVNLLAPRGAEDEAIAHFKELVKGYAEGFLALPRFPFEYPLPDFEKYYDREERRWRCPWTRLLRYALKPAKRPTISLPREVLLDPVDISIISELQVDALVKMSELANRLGLSPASLRYHFVNHVLARGLIRYAVRYLAYPKEPLSAFVIEADTGVEGLMEGFKGLPPVHGVASSLDGTKLILFVRASHEVKLGLYKVLKGLMDVGVVNGYLEVILDPSYVRKYSIPGPKYYRAGRWVMEEVVRARQ